MTFEELIANRYSVKNFSKEPVEEEKLKNVLEAACQAPTAKNAQSERIYVIRSADALQKAKELTPCTYGASTVLMFAYSKAEAYQYPEENGKRNSGEEDCSIAAVYTMFEAVEQGLGTCWVNNFSPTKAKQIFALPEDEEVVLLMPIGYPGEYAKALPHHFEKKPIESIVKEL